MTYVCPQQQALNVRWWRVTDTLGNSLWCLGAHRIPLASDSRCNPCSILEVLFCNVRFLVWLLSLLYMVTLFKFFSYVCFTSTDWCSWSWQVLCVLPKDKSIHPCHPATNPTAYKSDLTARYTGVIIAQMLWGNQLLFFCLELRVAPWNGIHTWHC